MTPTRILCIRSPFHRSGWSYGFANRSTKIYQIFKETESTMTEKVILDTDIGTDVDDAVALAYLLAQPKCELLGITTVTGEAIKRASLASVLTKAAGRDIPIFPGAEQPFQIEQKQPIAQQAAVLPKWPHETQFPHGQAVDFLRRSIHAHPGEITLLAIGPLTNVGQLFQTEPEIASLLKALVLMGGAFGSTYAEKAEWNISLDPQAAEIVYKANVPLHRSIGLDVTTQVFLLEADVRARFNAPILESVLNMAEIWYQHFATFSKDAARITFHDPLAAATIFDDSLCAYKRGMVEVDTLSLKLLGKTTFTQGGSDLPHQVAVSVDAERYFDHFFSVFN
jgi:purine nucleosidase